MFERVVSLVLVATTGCSYLLIDRPPRAVRKTDMMPGCTTELTWPVVDAVVGVIGVAGGIGIATGAIEPTADSMDPMGTMKRPLTSGEKFLAGSASLVEGLLFAWSAYHGYQATRGCRELRARMPQPMYPQGYPPPPYPQGYPPPQPQGYPQPQPQPQPQAYPQPQPQSYTQPQPQSYPQLQLQPRSVSPYALARASAEPEYYLGSVQHAYYLSEPEPEPEPESESESEREPASASASASASPTGGAS